MVVSAIVNIRAPLFSENSKRFGVNLGVTLEEQGISSNHQAQFETRKCTAYNWRMKLFDIHLCSD